MKTLLSLLILFLVLSCNAGVVLIVGGNGGGTVATNLVTSITSSNASVGIGIAQTAIGTNYDLSVSGGGGGVTFPFASTTATNAAHDGFMAASTNDVLNQGIWSTNFTIAQSQSAMQSATNFANTLGLNATNFTMQASNSLATATAASFLSSSNLTVTATNQAVLTANIYAMLISNVLNAKIDLNSGNETNYTSNTSNSIVTGNWPSMTAGYASTATNVPGLVSPTTFYVGLGGNDANTGNSLALKWLTLTNAAVKMTNGGQLQLEAGAYAIPQFSENFSTNNDGLTFSNGLTMEGTGAGFANSFAPPATNYTLFNTNTSIIINGGNSFRFGDNTLLEGINFFQSGAGWFPFGTANMSSSTNCLVRNCTIWGAFQQSYVEQSSIYGFTNGLAINIRWEHDVFNGQGHGVNLNGTNFSFQNFIDCTFQSRGMPIGSSELNSAIDITGNGQYYFQGGSVIATNGSAITNGSTVAGIYISSTGNTNIILGFSSIITGNTNGLAGATPATTFFDLIVSGNSNSIVIQNGCVNPNRILDLGLGNTFIYSTGTLLTTNSDLSQNTIAGNLVASYNQAIVIPSGFGGANFNQTYYSNTASGGTIILWTNAVNSNYLTNTLVSAGSFNTNQNVTSATLSQYRLCTTGAIRYASRYLYTGWVGVTGAAPIGTVTSALAFTGTFTGDGSGLTNLNASNLASGTIPQGVMPSIVITNNEANATVGNVFSVSNSLSGASGASLQFENFFGGTSYTNNILGGIVGFQFYNTGNGNFANIQGANFQGTNFTSLNGGQFTGNGAGLTNIPFAGLSPAAQVAVTNIAAAVTNGLTIASTNVTTSTGILSPSSNQTNYTLSLLPGELGNMEKIWLANTNVYLTLTGTNVADNGRTLELIGWTNSVVSKVTLNFTSSYHTNSQFSLYITNGYAAVWNLYCPDATGTNDMFSDAGRWQ